MDDIKIRILRYAGRIIRMEESTISNKILMGSSITKDQ
jgi:hypothetical protein